MKFLPLEDVLGASLGFFAAGLVALGISCSMRSGSDAGIPCNVPVAGSDSCVLPLVAGDVAKGMKWSDASADAVHRCGTDQQTVAAIWGAHIQAEVIEGFVPKMPVTDN